MLLICFCNYIIASACQFSSFYFFRSHLCGVQILFFSFAFGYRLTANTLAFCSNWLFPLDAATASHFWFKRQIILFSMLTLVMAFVQLLSIVFVSILLHLLIIISDNLLAHGGTPNSFMKNFCIFVFESGKLIVYLFVFIHFTAMHCHCRYKNRKTIEWVIYQFIIIDPSHHLRLLCRERIERHLTFKILFASPRERDCLCVALTWSGN